MAPPPVTARDLVRTASWLSWPGWDRFLIGWCAAFHAIAGLVLAFAPYELVLTQGTRPVLDLASRHTWALVFAVAAGLSWLLLHCPRPVVQCATWCVVLVTGGMWVTAFGLAVVRGQGSALGVVVWPFLYGPWVVVAVRVGLGKR